METYKKYLNEDLPKRIDFLNPDNRKKIKSFLTGIGVKTTPEIIDKFASQYGALMAMLKSIKR